MSNLSVNQPSGFDSKLLFVTSLNNASNIRLEGQISQTGNPILGEQVTTYSTLSFESGGITYHYDGSWQVTADRAILLADVSAGGSYDTIRLEANGDLLATYTGAPMAVDFGQSTGIPLLDLVANLLGMLIQHTASAGRAYANLNTDVSPDLYALAFAGDDTMTGNGGADSLFGGAGNDHIDGAAGGDTMDGGAGNDTYVVDSLADLVVEAADNGSDSVVSSISYTLGANVENLTLSGVGDINATGNAMQNLITGNAGANVLDGHGGNDTLVGGFGDDTYIIDTHGEHIVEDADGGTDTAVSSADYELGANVENLTLTGADSIDATGNGLHNVLRGNAGDNHLDGRAGTDTMIGGLGDDTYIVDNHADLVSEAVNQGNDTVIAGASFTLGANFENLFLTGTANINAIGNAGANVLRGNAGNNILNGHAGQDHMTGAAGNDIYYIDNLGDRAIEAANQGMDSVYASIDHVLGANIEKLYLAGSAPIDGYGNTLGNWIAGQSGDNLLSGGAGNDELFGGAGNDLLYGGAGNDVLYGGLGQDRLLGNAGADHFAFNTKFDGKADLIVDFSVPADTIYLENAVFTRVGAPGALSAKAFVTGAAAANANQHIIYNAQNGWLSYDSDGSGAARAVHFATVTAHLHLTAADFFVL